MQLQLFVAGIAGINGKLDGLNLGVFPSLKLARVLCEPITDRS